MLELYRSTRRFYRSSRKIYGSRSDIISQAHFLTRINLGVPLHERLFIAKQMIRISKNIRCPHTQREMISIIETIFRIPNNLTGCIVEAGSYKGGSAAKLSMACKLMNRRLMLFDSFEGIPENNERMPNGRLYHTPGIWRGSIDEVKSNIKRYGAIEVCEFVKGWFDHTMSLFNKPIVLMYLDVDLASSTRTCLKYLYPLLVPGGILYSQDGHLPPVIDVFDDDRFWQEEVRYPKPYVEGLRKKKLIRIVKSNSFQNGVGTT